MSVISVGVVTVDLPLDQVSGACGEWDAAERGCSEGLRLLGRCAGLMLKVPIPAIYDTHDFAQIRTSNL